jgi:ribosomal protein S18 acetylase RimI-like enzyme
LDRQYKPSEKIEEVTKADIVKFIDDDKSWIFVAEEDDRVIGYISGEIRKNHYLDLDNVETGNIKNFIVTKSSRNKKVGKTLYLYALEFLKKKGIHYLEVSVNAKNVPSLSAYKKLGFREFHIKLNQKI